MKRPQSTNRRCAAQDQPSRSALFTGVILFIVALIVSLQAAADTPPYDDVSAAQEEVLLLDQAIARSGHTPKAVVIAYADCVAFGGAVAFACQVLNIRVMRATQITIQYKIVYSGGTQMWGTAWAGTDAVWFIDGEKHSEAIDSPFDWTDMVDKGMFLLSAAGLATTLPAAISAVSTAYDFYEIAQKLQQLDGLGDTETRWVTFNFLAEPGTHRVSVGVQATTTAFGPGYAQACIIGEIPEIRIGVGNPISSIEIVGPDVLQEGETAQYLARACYEDGYCRSITDAVEWKDDSPFTSFSSPGLLNAGPLSYDSVANIDLACEECFTSQTCLGATTRKTVLLTNRVDLEEVRIEGPDRVDEASFGDFTCFAYFDDGTRKDVTASAIWSEDCPFASFPSRGELVVGDLPSSRMCDITASYAYNGVTKSDTESVALISTNKRLDRVEITGPSNVNEGTVADYTCKAFFDDGTEANVTSSAVWSESCPYTAISSNGRLTVGSLSSDKFCSVTSRYTYNEVSKSDTKSVNLRNIPEPERIVIAGPSEVNENTFADYTCRLYFNDGSNVDVTGEVAWSESCSYVSISSNGRLTVGNLSSDKVCSISANYAFDGGSKSTSRSVSLVNAEIPDRIVISGPDEANEGTSANYTCIAYFDDGSSVDVTSSASWSENSSYASITSGGLLSVLDLSSDSNCTISASYSYNGVTRYASKQIDINNIDHKQLVRIEITGPTRVNENTSADLTCHAYFDDGSSSIVTSSATWSEDTSYATITTNGRLSVDSLTSSKTCVISASYEYGGITKSDTMPLSLVDIAPPPPKQLERIQISGVLRVEEGSSASYRCTAFFSDDSWDSVTNEVEWSETCLSVEISGDGLLTVGDLTSTRYCTVTAEYEYEGVTKVDSVEVELSDYVRELDRIAITGPIDVPGGSASSFTCTAYFKDSSTLDVTSSAVWFADSLYADISADGKLLADALSSSISFTLSASYTHNEVTKEASKLVNIIPQFFTITCSLPAGANFISLPLIPKDSDIADVLYDDVDSSDVRFWSSGAESYRRPDTAGICVGYWIDAPNGGCMIDVTGLHPTGLQVVELQYAGWHAVGTPYTIAASNLRLSKAGMSKIWSEAVSAGWIGDSIWEFDATKKEYKLKSGTLSLWKGYWLETLVSGLTLIFDEDEAVQ